MTPLRETHKFQKSTLLLAVNWVNKFIDYHKDDFFKLWFKRLDESYVGIPQDVPYKQGYNTQYNISLSSVHADDKPMFAFLCRVLVYRYAFEKGFIACKSFNIADYVQNHNSELYQVGALKLGREHIFKTEPAKPELETPAQKPKRKLPILEGEWSVSTYTLAIRYLETVTSDNSFYKAIEAWFKSRLSFNNDFKDVFSIPNEVGLFYSVLKGQIESEEERKSFVKICKHLTFNYYVEQFLGIHIPLNYNITFKEPVDGPVEPIPLDVSGKVWVFFDESDKHFKPVENYMNTLTQFANVPSTTVHLVHGKPADSYTEQELMSLIRNARKAQNDIKDLVDTSERMKLRHEQLEEDIKVYVKVLDALPTADNNQPF